MPDFWVSDQGDKYHGWEGCRALEGHNVTRYDTEDAARSAATKHARCEAHACFARGRGAGLARLPEQALKDPKGLKELNGPNCPALHDQPADD
ncbi:hypothetical protein [Streptomyces sp. NPDC101776]|uniref:hypothetical protein n=1 Tax=Streptomyces sp. NPDC101776 TaxID=3366146 RepID=UPI0037F5B661